MDNETKRFAKATGNWHKSSGHEATLSMIVSIDHKYAPNLLTRMQARRGSISGHVKAH